MVSTTPYSSLNISSTLYTMVPPGEKSLALTGTVQNLILKRGDIHGYSAGLKSGESICPQEHITIQTALSSTLNSEHLLAIQSSTLSTATSIEPGSGTIREDQEVVSVASEASSSVSSSSPPTPQ
jgi:hypothetical protein